MNIYSTQNIVSKYIHPDPEIVQDMVLEYWHYSWDFLDPIAKMVTDFRYVICPRWYSNQCGFVQWATYRLLFQNPKITKVLIIAISDKVKSPTTLSDCKLQESAYDTDIYTSAAYSDLITSESDDLELFESCINQTTFINTYHKLDSMSFLLLPKWYKDIKKILKSSKIQDDPTLWISLVANLTKYDSERSSDIITKDNFIWSNQNILDKLFSNKLKKKDVNKNNFVDIDIFLAFASLFYENSPVLSMYYDTFRTWNKTANSYVWIVV